MVQHLAGIVKQGARRLCDYLLKGQFFQAAAGEQFVKVVHVRLKVFAVMELEGPCGNHGLKGVKRVWKVDKLKHIRRA